MLPERIRIVAFELWMLAYMIYRAKVRFTITRLRRQGRAGDAEAMVTRIVTEWTRWVLDNLRCRLEVEGLEHLPRDEGFVVFSNHQSKYDIPTLIAALERPLGFVTKRELFRIPGLAFWMRQVHCLPIDRRDISGGASSLATLGADLQRSRQGFVVFPEGTRTRDPERRIGPFRRGAMRLVAESGLPVVPVALDGTRLLDSVSAMAGTRHGGRVVRVRILPPRRLEANTAPARRALTDELAGTIRSNWEAIRVEWPQT